MRAPRRKRLPRFGAVMALALCAASAAHGQDMISRWIVDARSGCRLWNLSPDSDERIEWRGACVGGYGQGRGLLKWYVNGALYEIDDGEFAHGMMNGHVTMTFADGSHFDGAFRDHLPNGHGTLRTAGNEIYSGVWTSGCFDDGKRRMSFGVRLSDCKFVS
jgi:hypothetical protein